MLIDDLLEDVEDDELEDEGDELEEIGKGGSKLSSSLGEGDEVTGDDGLGGSGSLSKDSSAEVSNQSPGNLTVLVDEVVDSTVSSIAFSFPSSVSTGFAFETFFGNCSGGCSPAFAAAFVDLFNELADSLGSDLLAMIALLFKTLGSFGRSGGGPQDVFQTRFKKKFVKKVFVK